MFINPYPSYFILAFGRCKRVELAALEIGNGTVRGRIPHSPHLKDEARMNTFSDLSAGREVDDKSKSFHPAWSSFTLGR